MSTSPIAEEAPPTTDEASPASIKGGLRRLMEDVREFSRRLLPKRAMRRYQEPAAVAIADSVINRRGLQFVVVFSRQAGKDELLAQVLTWLVTRFSVAGGWAVMAAPTDDQVTISQDRLAARLKDSPLTHAIMWQRDNTAGVGAAGARFLSAHPTANVRGATADLLLVANEAQDIDPGIWDARFDPMATSTNATTVYLGTTWMTTGLLSRQMKYLAKLEAEDGIQRVFKVDWTIVAEELPAYGKRVRDRIKQLGETHPFIRTEYMLEELDSEGGLFTPERIAQLQGQERRYRRAADGPPGARYVLLVDVAGEEETDPGPESFDASGKRDSTALTVVRIVEEIPGELRYQVVDRMAWTGVRHTQLHPQLVDLAVNVWGAVAVVVDAVGVGAGLTSFLTQSLKRSRIHVHPFIFTQQSKSDLGWDLIGLIDSGRLKDYVRDDTVVTQEFWSQLGKVEYEILQGPKHILRWSVPTSKGHDDLVLSMALVASLDELDLRSRIAKGSA